MRANVVFKARHAMGRTVRGIALVANDGFSARYDLNRSAGIFSRPAHKLAGRSYVDRILVLDTAKGGVASAWMLHEMKSRGVSPLAFVFNSVNPILVQGSALGDVPMLAGFDVDITGAIPDGAEIEVDPRAGIVRILDALSHCEERSDAAPDRSATRSVRCLISARPVRLVV